MVYYVLCLFVKFHGHKWLRLNAGQHFCTWPHVPCLCEQPQYGRCPGDSGAWPSLVAGRAWWHIACVSVRSIWHAAWMKKGDENLLYWHCLKPLWILWYTIIACFIRMLRWCLQNYKINDKITSREIVLSWTMKNSKSCRQIIKIKLELQNKML